MDIIEIFELAARPVKCVIGLAAIPPPPVLVRLIVHLGELLFAAERYPFVGGRTVVAPCPSVAYRHAVFNFAQDAPARVDVGVPGTVLLVVIRNQQVRHFTFAVDHELEDACRLWQR